MQEETTSAPTREPRNYLIFQDSGKPIFARHGTDEQVVQICGMLQGLRASFLYDDTSLHLGEVQSVEMGSGGRMVWWHVCGMTMVAMDPNGSSTEAYLRFVLETLYFQLAFSLTQPVLDSISLYPDLESVMGTTERQLHSLLDQLDPSFVGDSDDELSPLPPLPMIHPIGSGAVQPLYPMSSAVRDEASTALKDVGDVTPDTLFAFLFVARSNTATTGSSLITLVQSPSRGLQLRAADLTLLLWFLMSQQSSSLLVTSESLWLPVCLPRFNASGYVYCYARCLDRETGLCIGWVSHMGTTKQFGLFQHATATVCSKLSIPLSLEEDGNIPEKVYDGYEATELEKQRKEIDEKDDAASDQDYVDASGDGDRMIPYVAAKGLVEEVTVALDSMVVDKLHAQYFDICQAMHFCFRYDISLPRSSRQTPGRLSQCLCSQKNPHFSTLSSRRKLWSIYDKLMMRLRLGSAQSESIQDATSMISHDRQANGHPPVHLGVDYACHAAALLEAPPDFSGMTSECVGEYRYVGINGEAFELYFTVSNELSVKQATTLGAKLVRRFLMDQKKLFLWSPLVWKK